MAEITHYHVINGTIINVENGKSSVGALEIRGNHIKGVYPSNEVLSDGIPVIDAKGKYIIPGLLDMHCHIQERFAPHFLASGVTTVRNTAGNVHFLEKLINAPMDAPTPAVYAADRMIDGSPGLWGPTSFGNFVTDDPEEAREEVRRQVGAGAKFIKVYGWANREVMHATVDEAKKFGLEVSCDLIHSKEFNALDAAHTGVTWFEHASGFAQAIYPGWYPTADQTEWSHINWDKPDENKIQELCEQMIQYNVKLCPTLVVTDQVEQAPDYWYPKNKITESLKKNNILIEHWRNMSEQVVLLNEQVGKLNKFTKMVAKTYFDLGGTVVTGTDTPALIWTFPGMALHRELKLFVEIGLTEMEALQAATIKAAQSINLDTVGAIKEGNIADIIILNNNPLEDIKHTKDIHRVIKGGKVFSQKEILGHVPSEKYMEQQLSEFQKKWEAITM